MLVGDGVHVRVVAAGIIDLGIIHDVFLVGVVGRDFDDAVDHLPGAADDDVGVCVLGELDERGRPFGRVVGHFDRLGLDPVAVLLLDQIHAVLGGIEEGFVAEGAVDEQHDLDRIAACARIRRVGVRIIRSAAGKYQQDQARRHQDCQYFFHCEPLFLLLCLRTVFLDLFRSAAYRTSPNTVAT